MMPDNLVLPQLSGLAVEAFGIIEAALDNQALSCHHPSCHPKYSIR